ncbi:TetR/AcrR family transcriptional regulator [Heyndrickxia acidicola]|uniref:TetR/AcrR family transcriptional regulator n=1 Tax=Heyndrickxia acidicola TaxID=209389 RepID=A0ABU6MJ34_9BACI|nr:TetR/AcrR family transcriptional regulator [Heyndrickxia acidicola]MED1204679.1 TetR/AcrR family transcriptional regulator [Heyndrickxia acidicola]
MGKGESTKQLIIEHSRKLFAKKGFDSSKTSEIAKACGISEATIYKYFTSKNDLLMACVTPDYADGNEKKFFQSDLSDVPLEELIKGYVTDKLNLIVQNRCQFEILFNETLHHPELSTEYVKQFYQRNDAETEIERRIDQGLIKGISDFFLFRVGLISAILAVMNQHEIHDKEAGTYFTPSKIAELVEFVLYGIYGKREELG